VLAKAIGTGPQHEGHDDNRKHLMGAVLGLYGAVQFTHKELTEEAKMVQSSQPRLDLDLTRDQSRIATKAGVVKRKTIHGT
jgi:hypothetical protein